MSEQRSYFSGQAEVFISLIRSGMPNHNMLDYKILVPLPHVSRSTVMINFQTNHLNQPGNVINPPPPPGARDGLAVIMEEGKGGEKG